LELAQDDYAPADTLIGPGSGAWPFPNSDYSNRGTMIADVISSETADRDRCTEVGMALAFMFLRRTGVHRELLDSPWITEGQTYDAGLGHTCREVARAFLSHADIDEALTDTQKMCARVGKSLASLDVAAAVATVAQARGETYLTAQSPRWAGIADGLADIVDGYRLRLAQYLDTLGSELSFRAVPDVERSELFVLLATALFGPKPEVLRGLGQYLNAFDDHQVILAEASVDAGGGLTDETRQRLLTLLAKYHAAAG